MTTYKQINFKRNCECTNVKFIQVLDDEQLDANFWQICDDDEINCDQLYKQGNKIYFGYL